MPAPPPEASGRGRTAPPGGAPEAGPDAARVLVCSVQGREFALPIEAVVDVVRHTGATPVPGAGHAVAGILPLRGRMVTLLELRRLLDLPDRPAGATARIVVLESSGDRVGLVVDAVSRVSVASRDGRADVQVLDPGAVVRGLP